MAGKKWTERAVISLMAPGCEQINGGGWWNAQLVSALPKAG